MGTGSQDLGGGEEEESYGLGDDEGRAGHLDPRAPGHASALIAKYFPNDDPTTDDAEHSACRAAEVTWEEAEEARITLSEVAEIAKRRTKRKAPGVDGFPSAGLVHLVGGAGRWVVDVFNRCLEEGVFPRVWKVAGIAWIPKPSGDGLRPICLLPTIGKLLDRVLASRLAHHLEVSGFLHPNQFGFRRGRGTTEAIRRAAEGMRAAKDRGVHSLLVALDIKNAFNSAWYPKIRQLLSKKRVPKNLAATTIDFLRERRIRTEGVEQATERGCPQGSCLGPILWLLVMEDWFDAIESLQVQPGVAVDAQAFADDGLIQVEGPSVKRIEEAWNSVWTACCEWAHAHKLEFAPQKTTAIFVPARRIEREPRVKLGDVVVEPGYSMKYLGVILDRKLLWVEHAAYVRGKIAAAGHRIRAVVGKLWGTKPLILKIVFSRAIRPALLHGAEVWGERWEDSRVQRHLTAAQRPFLLGICRAYRTTSNAAIQVLAGCVPLHLEARSRFRRSAIRRERSSEGPILLEREPHPGAGRLRWMKLRGDDRRQEEGVWIFTDASVSGDRVGFGVVTHIQGEEVTTVKRRLQEGFPVHAAELTAMAFAVANLPAGETGINLVSDSRVALDMVRERKGATAQEIDWRARRLTREGGSVRFWWNDGSSAGLSRADRIAREARDDEDAPREEGKRTAKMAAAVAKKEAISAWQLEWARGDTGRLTFSVCSQVAEGLRDWGPWAVWLLTGHGPFRAYYSRFGLREGDGACRCGGGLETGEHVLISCTLEHRKEAREEFRRRQLARGAPFPFRVGDDTKKGEVSDFNRMAEAMLRGEEEAAAAEDGGGR